MTATIYMGVSHRPQFNNFVGGHAFVQTKDANYFSFYRIDEYREEKLVICKGAKPQDIERDENAVAFYTSKVSLKYPLKYNGNEAEIIDIEVSPASCRHRYPHDELQIFAFL
ncbi:MAG TPA: hypothetical protein H9825_13525 [Candidatus Sphingobacterium stercorigallinarum]|nr:hypothetical protein [Candidatus Sphingobacterium stercorigallinarum]